MGSETTISAWVAKGTALSGSFESRTRADEDMRASRWILRGLRETCRPRAADRNCCAIRLWISTGSDTESR
ncbi:hypothetical protein GCM10007890_44500 [Methylobacterium tardum]|uniref:Uncharacterized protein n=1 Tax=Methylobacterium tardum TaxID=374432 RepID=A0AA37TIZ6_9HYPH|nr:hypothetical protein GCM10007890_44500 [Methylobacterium tardum]